MNKLSIAKFGAVGDGCTVNTQAIQSAIDACPVGGTVIVPAGIFVTGAVFLHSDMTLWLQAGATIVGSGQLSDYPLFTYRFEGLETTCYASLINTKQAEDGPLHDIAIVGEGTIDANGALLKRLQQAENHGKRGRAVCIRHADRVRIEGVTIRQSPGWCLHLIYCTDVQIHDVKIFTRYAADGKRYEGMENGDGIDIDSCRDVQIWRCFVASQDDNIAIKSGRDEEGRRVGIPSEDILIWDCDFHYGFGVVVGSEASGGVRNVLVKDCRFTNSFSIGSVKTPRGRGNVVENITYRNCTLVNRAAEPRDCEWFRGALYVDHFYSHKTFDPQQAEPITEDTPTIRNVTFENIDLETVGGNAIFLAGLKERSLQNITLRNIRAIGKYGMKAINIDGLSMENVTVQSAEDEPYQFENVTRL